ncbi:MULTISPECIES: hypothetical protein [unclassified Novosphingobium]|nr:MULTISPECIES: hypothetical protein [unclassified Novosphingobium]NMN85855.1 hypothetical protein [Novosphingobium sp. SG916]
MMLSHLLNIAGKMRFQIVPLPETSAASVLQIGNKWRRAVPCQL